LESKVISTAFANCCFVKIIDEVIDFGIESGIEYNSEENKWCEFNCHTQRFRK
jgi:hypothetical protein